MVLKCECFREMLLLWAISNAFLYLVEYLKDKKTISIDPTFAMTMIAPPTSSLRGTGNEKGGMPGYVDI